MDRIDPVPAELDSSELRKYLSAWGFSTLRESVEWQAREIENEGWEYPCSAQEFDRRIEHLRTVRQRELGSDPMEAKAV
jgi:hypothetical protein